MANPSTVGSVIRRTRRIVDPEDMRWWGYREGPGAQPADVLRQVQD